VLEQNRVRIGKDRLYPTGDDDRLFADTAVYLSFIGAVVIERALWQSRSKEPYIGSEFIHFGVIFQAPLPGSALLIATPLVRIRYGTRCGRHEDSNLDVPLPALVWSIARDRPRQNRKVATRERWHNPLLLLAAIAPSARIRRRSMTRLIAPRKGSPCRGSPRG